MDQIGYSPRAILTFIGELEARSGRVIVTDIVNEGCFGSPPTVYMHLAALERDGWIESRQDPKDGRVKQLVLSERSRKAFKKMSIELRELTTPQKSGAE